MSNIVHSLISPSYLKQILLCSRSLPRDSEALNDTNEAASRGTMQHAYLFCKLAEHFGQPTEDEEDFSSLTQEEIDEVNLVYTRALVEYKNLRRKYAVVDVLLETKVNLDSFLPTPSWGYVDIAYVCHKKKLDTDGKYHNTFVSVLDAKFGFLEVKVEEHKLPNPQLAAYWVGIYDSIKEICEVTRGKLTILQPKLINYPSKSYSTQKLLDYANEVLKPVALDAVSETGKYNPSLENCKYCKNSKHCKYHNIMAKATLEMLDNPDMLSDDFIEALLPQINTLRKYCDNLWDYAIKKSQEGKKWSNYHLGTSRPSRVYEDEDKVKDFIKINKIDDLLVETLLSPAQAEKVLGKEQFANILADFVTLKPGKVTLVEDKPQNKKINAKNDFKKENN